MKLLTLLFLLPILALANQYELKFLQDFNFNHKQEFGKTTFGGVSALTYNQKTKELILLSDDKGNVHNPRYYVFSLTANNGKFALEYKRLHYLLDKNGKKFDLNTDNFYLDAEGIIQLDRDNLIISSEKNIYGSYLHVFNKNKFSKNISIPKKYISINKIKGFKHNRGLEGLTITPGRKFFYTISENRLQQDKKGRTKFSHLLKYKLLNKEFKFMQEYIYPHDKVKKNGVSEVLAIDENILWVLERSYYKKRNSIRINQIDLAKPKLDKKLIADIDNFKHLFSKNYQKLDNFEALGFGPQLPNGNSTLLMMSDNNFSKKQVSKLLIFEIISK